LAVPFCDLGVMPLSNSYVHPDNAHLPEQRFPLAVRVCEACQLAQLSFIADAEAIFSHYAYMSSYSSGWLTHATRFAETARARLGLQGSSFVVEVASNDGYLLRNFVAAGIPCLGVEPAANVAAVAQAAGIPTEVCFFGLETARKLLQKRGAADLVVANNVLAHVPDVNDFVAGLACMAGAQGVVAIEAPHLLRLVEHVQFDTIYHEHYAYWSLHSIARVLGAHGLAVFDVERLPTHGGSLRVWAAAPGSRWCVLTAGLADVRAEEDRVGVSDPSYYAGFQQRIDSVLSGAREYFAEARRAGRRVAGYGAAAKGNTFLNALPAGSEHLLFVADLNAAKQGHLLPGSRIPVVAPDRIAQERPDDLLILPWNIAGEVRAQWGSALAQWGGRFVVALPRVSYFPAAA